MPKKKRLAYTSLPSEQDYRDWRNSLPDNLKYTNDNDYDMRAAFNAGMQPVLEKDGYHLQSRDRHTGRILKAPHHPSYLIAINNDARLGYYPVSDNKGNTYTFTWPGNKFRLGGKTDNENNEGLFGNKTIDNVTSYLPILGTAQDAYNLYKNPSWENAGWLALSLAGDLAGFGVLKGVKAGAKAVKAARKTEKAAKEALHTHRKANRNIIARSISEEDRKLVENYNKAQVDRALKEGENFWHKVTVYPISGAISAYDAAVNYTQNKNNKKRLGGRVRFGDGGYVRKRNNNPIAFDNEGNLVDQVTGEQGTLLLPEVTITKNTPTFDEQILKGLDTATRKAIEGIGNITINPLMRGYGYAAKGLYDLFNSKPGYKDAKTPYGTGLGHERDNIINVSNSVAGTRNRLEMMGFRNVDGKYKYPNPKYVPGTQKEVDELKAFLGTDDPNAQYEFLRWCAENANIINGYYRRPTAGNAWTRHGIYGDSAIVVAPNRKTDWQYKLVPKAENKARSMSKDQARYVRKHIDDEGVELKSGDIVDMRYPGSSYAKVAWNEGDIDRANSHTGTIIKTGPDKEHTYVAHYFNGGLQVEPIGKLLGVDWNDPYITGIRRPGRKEHPYKKCYGGKVRLVAAYD